MDAASALAALGALAHEHRLSVFRLLVQRGPAGCSAGEIAQSLGMAPSTLTFHTQALVRAGLARQARAGRRILFTADFAAMAALVGFLTETCCGGAGLAACLPEKAAPTRREA